MRSEPRTTSSRWTASSAESPARSSSADSARNAEIGRRLTEVFFDQQIGNSPVTWDFNEFSYEIRDLFTDSYRLTTFGLLVGFVLWWAAIGYAVLTGESRREWLMIAGGVLVTALVYIAGLHWSYRFTFGARGLDLPSYVRYVHVIALPMLLLSFCPLLPAFRGISVKTVLGTFVGGPYRNERRSSPRLQSRCSGLKRPIYGRSWSPIRDSLECGQTSSP